MAGDKSGAWTQWYREAIPLADNRYTTYLASQHDKATPETRIEAAGTQTARRPRTRRKEDR
jgi:hypothetical protein